MNIGSSKMSQKYIVSAECAIRHAGKYLVIKRPDWKNAGGCLAFPGGGCEIEDGENNADILVQIAKREVFEEVGLELGDNLQYVCSSMFYDNTKKSNVIHSVFFYDLISKKFNLTVSPDEVPEYFWMLTEDIIIQKNCPEWIKNYLKIIESKFS